MYETPKREITALTVGSDGTIYASAIGERPRNPTPAPNMVIATPQSTTTITAGADRRFEPVGGAICLRRLSSAAHLQHLSHQPCRSAR